LSKNLTLSCNNVIYQIRTKRAAYTMRSAQVEVRETSTGDITIEYKGRLLEHAVYYEQEQHQAKVVPSTSSLVASLASLRLHRELDASQRTPWRTLHPAQVGDISTLRIRVTFQLGVYMYLPVVDISVDEEYCPAVLITG
jgi:hypothetical protein